MSYTGTHLILGGNGFVGRHVALHLASLGLKVTIASRSTPAVSFPRSVASSISWIQVDMATADWGALLSDIDVVHHYAWSTVPASANNDPYADLSANVGATVALLEEMRLLKTPPRLVFSSSGGTVYGKLQQIPVTEDHGLDPITAYGASKAAVEHYLGYYRSVHGLDCVVARVANPYGAGQSLSRGQGAVTTFISRALKREEIAIWGTGNIIRDYIHISDAAAGLAALALASMDMSGPWRFNIASGQGTSLNQIIIELERILGRQLPVRRESERTFDVPVSVLDISLAQKTLSWEPSLSFSDGMTLTLRDLEIGNHFSTLYPLENMSTTKRSAVPTN
jgi:UDP-glucose 4-epimerase